MPIFDPLPLPHFSISVDESMRVMAARMIFHLLSMPNRQVYAHMLIYIELSVSPLHNGVKIFLMRDDAGIVTFFCNNMAKNIFFQDLFIAYPLILSASNRI